MRQKRGAQWSRLDNAAKIFPSTSNKWNTKVFRFACELQEPVEQALLQQALDRNMESFPLFGCVLKRGLFWYYLEAGGIAPVVRQEEKLPCSPIYDRNARTLLFEVSYFDRKINLEVYHALTDGTGALQFLRALVYNYLVLRYKEEFSDSIPMMDYDVSETQKMDDSFLKYYNAQKKGKRKKGIRAYQIKGLKNSEHRMKIIEGIMPAKQIVEKAREYHASVTVFLAAVFVHAIFETMAVRDRKKPIILSIPVNLRNFFQSQSERNFFSVIYVSYTFGEKKVTFDELIRDIDAAFKRELQAEKLEEKIGALLALQENMIARAIPLPIKDIVLKIANKKEEQTSTVSLSNVGIVKMPEGLKRYIRLFDVFISTTKLQICMCSYEEKMAVSFTSSFSSTEIQKHFFRMLTKMGIEVEIIANQV